MWKLTIVDDEGKQTELPLSREEYAIGRAEENTVRLTARNISRKHLIIKRSDDKGWIVEDLESYNGCFVNGMRVSGTHPLYHGDLLQLGDYRLEIQDETADFDGEVTQEYLNTSSASLLDRPDRLVVVDGTAAGSEFPLEGERIILGRAEDADISINHSSVSRTHAEIINLGAGVYELFDRGSSNGVRVNGTSFERRVIEDDDEIELGDVRLRFVARGRIFRPGGTSKHNTSTASAQINQRKSGLGLMVMVGAALGIVAIIGYVTLSSPTSDSSHSSEIERIVLDQKILEEAKKFSEADQHDTAHAKLNELPETSLLRDSKLVRRIEGRWADEMFARTATSSDLAKRRKILEEISAALLVDATRRKRASDMLARMDNDGTDIDNLPVADQKSTDAEVKESEPPDDDLAPNPFANPKKPAAATKPPSAVATARPTARPLPASATKPSSDDMSKDILAGKNDKMRKALEPRVYSGRATVEEIKILRAICRQQQDFACASKCTALLKAKK